MDIEELKKTLIEDGVFRADGRFNPAWLKHRSINYNWDGLDGDTVIEKVYLLFHERKYCKICGKPTPFRNYTLGYPDTCSRECKKIFDAETLRKVGKECQLPEARIKRQKTLENKYGEGITNVFQVKSIKEQIKSTNLEKYGVEHPAQNPDILAKGKQTQEDRYGGWYTQTEEYRERSKSTRCDRISKYELEHNCTEVEKIIQKYGQGWQSLGLPKIVDDKYKYISNEHLPKIKEYFDTSIQSHEEVRLLDYCKTLLPDVEILSGDRSVIKSSQGNPMELDIYVPSKYVALEYNGVYWHSFREPNYHLYKTEECNKQGIRLLHIWEDLWITKQDIYKSIITSAFGIYKYRIYARNCECKPIDSNTYRQFLENNHIQGAVNSSIRLGLYYNGELVQVAGWGKSRFKNGEYELHRMCSKLNTQVIGGFSKLIKHSNLTKFISYVDRSLYDGTGYKATGFITIGYTKPSYFYWNNNGRINRLSAQKHKLNKLLPNFDDNLTETENMLANGYLQLYDCGNIKVMYDKLTK